MKKLNLEALNLEITEVAEATAMEEMGASQGENNCCSVVVEDSK